MRYVFDPLTKLYLYSSATETPENSISIAPDPEMVEPHWDGAKWVDHQPQKPSLQDQIDKLDNICKQLSQQVSDLSGE